MLALWFLVGSRVNAQCAGDCNDDRSVSINELILGVNIVLGNRSVDACPAFDRDGGAGVGISDLVAAVVAAEVDSSYGVILKTLTLCAPAT